MKISSLSLLTALLLSSPGHCDDCVGLYRQAAQKTAVTTIGKIQAMWSDLTSTKCGSLRTVSTQILGREREARTQLEDKKPFDPVAAQANFEEAIKDDVVKSKLEEGKSIEDEDMRTLYEAAVFDAEGFYGARDLVVRQLQQKVGMQPSK